MTAPQPKLSSSQMENLKSVCGIGPVLLASVSDRLERGELLISRSRIIELMADVVGGERGEDLARFVFGMTVGYRMDNSEPEATLRGLRAIMNASDTPPEVLAGWDDCEPELRRMIVSKSVRLATKALDVSYDFERVYTGGRFLTSIRPVFDHAREEVQGVAIVQTLRLEYLTASGGETSLSIALDRGDIEQLQQSCAEAIRKGDLAYSKASEDWRMPVMMSGGGPRT